jgi:hypothetical protein
MNRDAACSFLSAYVYQQHLACTRFIRVYTKMKLDEINWHLFRISGDFSFKKVRDNIENV